MITKNRARVIRELIRLGEVYGTETAHFQQRAAAALGLGVTDVKALSALMQEGPMTAGQLTQRLGLTTGAGTLLLDRLAKAGYVERQPHATDRRKVLVAMSRSKLTATNNVYGPIGASFEKLLAKYTLDELECLTRFHEDAIAMTRSEIERLAKGSRGQ